MRFLHCISSCTMVTASKEKRRIDVDAVDVANSSQIGETERRPLLPLLLVVSAIAALFVAFIAPFSPISSSIFTSNDGKQTIPDRGDHFKVYWMAPFMSGGGYCSEAIAIVQALQGKATVRGSQHGDSLNPSFTYGLPRDLSDLLSSTLNDHQMLRDLSDVVAVCHSEPGAWFPARYYTSRCPPIDRHGRSPKYTIGRTMFETDRLPDGWKDRLNKLDEIWVPAQFHVDTFARGGVERDKLYVIGEPVDAEFFSCDNAQRIWDEYKRNENKEDVVRQRKMTHGRTGDESVLRSLLGEEKDDVRSWIQRSLVHKDAVPVHAVSPERHPYRFLSIFKWEERKGWKFLLEAFLRAFAADFSSPSDRGLHSKAELYILTNPYHSDPDVSKPVQQLHYNIPQIMLPLVYDAMDCFVIPSRGEGWGRPHIEAMSMELPVIATNFSGNLEFMNTNNSYLIAVEEMEEIEEGPFAGHRWAKPSISHLQQLMQHVFAYRLEARSKGKQARADVNRFYTGEAIGTKIIHRLHELRIAGKL